MACGKINSFYHGCVDQFYQKIWSKMNNLKKRKLGGYDYSNEGDIGAIGIIPFKEEWKYELPRTMQARKIDFILFTGFHSDGTYVAIWMGRKFNGTALLEISIKLPNKETYHLPQQYAIQQENGFVSAGLKIECLSPLRKWRVFYNGFLHRTGTGMKGDACHVTFTFLWFANSNVHDHFKTVMTENTPHFVSRSFSSIVNSERIEECFDIYDQCGLMKGIMTIDNRPRKELYLLSIRTRGNIIEDALIFPQIRIYGVNKRGIFVNINTINLPELINDVSHGFLNNSDHMIHPIKLEYADLFSQVMRRESIFLKTDSFTYELDLHQDRETFGSFVFTSAELNGENMLLIFHEYSHNLIMENHLPKVLLHTTFRDPEKALVVNLQDQKSQNPHFIGSRASTLVKLQQIMRYENKRFSVPIAFAVTTNGYRIHTGRLPTKFEDLEKKWHSKEIEAAELCEKLKKDFENFRLMYDIRLALDTAYQKTYGEKWTYRNFLIKASYIEDEDEVDFPKHEEVYIRATDRDQVFKAILKCWSSQFTVPNLNLKRMKGQFLNFPMAVIVQEEVNSSINGKIITCDTITYSPAIISIFAKYKLEESSCILPDDIRVSRYPEPTIVSRKIGNERCRMNLPQETMQTALREDEILRLARVGLLIEKYMGSLQEINWCFSGDDKLLFLLQTVQVNAMNKLSDFEIQHDLDSGYNSEEEFWSRSDVGEVIPGAITPLSLTTLFKIFDILCQQMFLCNKKELDSQICTFSTTRYIVMYNHIFYNLISTFRWLNTMVSRSFCEAYKISFFGYYFDFQNIEKKAEERFRYSYNLDISLIYSIYKRMEFFEELEEYLKQFKLPIDIQSTAEEVYKIITESFWVVKKALKLLMYFTLAGLKYNFQLLQYLRKINRGWSPAVFADFLHLTSSCAGSVECAQIPDLIEVQFKVFNICLLRQRMAIQCDRQEISERITRIMAAEKFHAMEDKEALRWLNECPSSAGIKFRELLSKHGHRCIREFDFISEPWEIDPFPLIRYIKRIVQHPRPKPNKQFDFEVLAVEIESQLRSSERRKMKKLHRKCVKTIQFREKSKSMVVKTMNVFRQGFNILGNLLVDEGRIPDSKLLFYLTFEEIGSLLKTRSIKIIARALKRMEHHPINDRYQFCHVGKGEPIIQNFPPGYPEKMETFDKYKKVFGIPVCQGKVKGRARVIYDVTEYENIREGDILITSSPDLGWCFYFPHLSGIVTEFEGLVSHEAIIAREYGIPCVINAQGATKVFQTGDEIVLDCTEGVVLEALK